MAPSGHQVDGLKLRYGQLRHRSQLAQGEAIDRGGHLRGMRELLAEATSLRRGDFSVSKWFSELKDLRTGDSHP